MSFNRSRRGFIRAKCNWVALFSVHFRLCNIAKLVEKPPILDCFARAREKSHRLNDVQSQFDLSPMFSFSVIKIAREKSKVCELCSVRWIRKHTQQRPKPSQLNDSPPNWQFPLESFFQVAHKKRVNVNLWRLEAGDERWDYLGIVDFASMYASVEWFTYR